MKLKQQYTPGRYHPRLGWDRPGVVPAYYLLLPSTAGKSYALAITLTADHTHSVVAMILRRWR